MLARLSTVNPPTIFQKQQQILRGIRSVLTSSPGKVFLTCNPSFCRSGHRSQPYHASQPGVEPRIRIFRNWLYCFHRKCDVYVCYLHRCLYSSDARSLCQYTVILTAVGRFGLIAVLLFLSGGNFGSIRSTKICFGF